MEQDEIEGAAEKLKMRVVNAHYQLQCDRRINLHHLSAAIGPSGKLHRGRPTMLSCRMMTKRVQFFPNGTVQVLGGGVTPSLLNHLHTQISHLLRQCDSNFRMENWRVNNFVFHFEFPSKVKLNGCICTQHFSYEPELFPAALISKWHPAHVTLFRNGKGMITGVKSEYDAQCILDDLPTFLAHHTNLSKESK